MPEVDKFKAFLFLMLGGVAAAILIYIADITVLPFLGNASSGVLSPI